MAHREVVISIQKQTKNRNDTGSNLSLGTRLTVLSKRLGRKRCCDTTPDISRFFGFFKFDLVLFSRI